MTDSIGGIINLADDITNSISGVVISVSEVTYEVCNITNSLCGIIILNREVAVLICGAAIPKRCVADLIRDVAIQIAASQFCFPKAGIYSLKSINFYTNILFSDMMISNNDWLPGNRKELYSQANYTVDYLTAETLGRIGITGASLNWDNGYWNANPLVTDTGTPAQLVSLGEHCGKTLYFALRSENTRGEKGYTERNIRNNNSLIIFN
jgi:hypothetical protein